MRIYYFLMLLLVSFLSCIKETPKVKQVNIKKSNVDFKNISVVNTEDPVCLMKTSEFLKDTTLYKGHIFGFCSNHCKIEFQKNPEKYDKK